METEDDEFTRERPPARRGGGGGGTVDAVDGGDRATPEKSGFDIGVDLSEFARGFGFSWLCLRESGGVGGSRFCDIWRFGTLADSEYVSRLGMEIAA